MNLRDVDKPAGPSAPRRSQRRWWQSRFLPQAPLGTALVVGGLINIIAGLRGSHRTLTGTFGSLSSIGESLAVLGSSSQVLLGAGLALVGIGLFWRLRAAWAFALLILAVTIGLNAARAHWDATLALPVAIFATLIATRRSFRRSTILASYLISLVSILGILAYGTFGTYLLGAGFAPQVHDFSTAFYYTIVTLATVGYGDIVPKTAETRLFAETLIIVGLSIFATALASTLGPALSGQLAHIFGTEREAMKYKNHVILVGDGHFAENTARELTHRGVQFIRIVSEGNNLSASDGTVVKGDPRDDEVLRKAGIADSRMLIAARDDDGANAFITLLAKDLNPNASVLAVANSVRSIRPLTLAHADVVFAPAVAGGRLLADLVDGVAIPKDFHDLLSER